VAAGAGDAGLAAALIVAAGSGERLRAGGPKALVELAGRPMYEYSLEACRQASKVGQIVIAVPPGKAAAFGTATGAGSGVRIVEGGATRSHSVAAGLALIDSATVVVHDAARPLVTPGLIDEAVTALEAATGLDGVIAAAPVTDTIKRVGKDSRVSETLDRSTLRAVQTPQVFRRAALSAAIAAGDLDNATDDASLVEAAGGAIAIMDSPSFNIKVTVPEDIASAEAILADRDRKDDPESC
jgi:2-C-methyl-D-erythritol 4-phosphate cytidylyltransferase